VPDDDFKPRVLRVHRLGGSRLDGPLDRDVFKRAMLRDQRREARSRRWRIVRSTAALTGACVAGIIVTANTDAPAGLLVALSVLLGAAAAILRIMGTPPAEDSR
jgi:hypothetical protein